MTLIVNLRLKKNDQSVTTVLKHIVEAASKIKSETIITQHENHGLKQISINIVDGDLSQFEKELVDRIKPLGLSAHTGFTPTPVMNISS